MEYKAIKNIDVTGKVEKKGDFNYLSWAWAWDQVLENDIEASYEYPEPTMYPDGSMMVYCDVTFLGRKRRSHLPVLDFRNKPIQKPNAFEINTAMQRCFVKAIAMHGLGLFIYAGEDLPEEKKAQQAEGSRVAEICTLIDLCKDDGALIELQEGLEDEVAALSEYSQKAIEQKIEFRAEQIKNGVEVPVKHSFSGVGDALDWAKRMKPVIEGFKSTKALMDWEQDNRPFIDGLSCLSAKKYEKDGKTFLERFDEAIENKYQALKTAELSQQPLAEAAE